MIYYHPAMSEAERNQTKELIEEFYKTYPLKYIEIDNIIPGEGVIINWACIWNDPNKMGEGGVVAATDGKVSIVQFKDMKINVYRNEDLIPQLKQRVS
jgi:hypothetical protein